MERSELNKLEQELYDYFNQKQIYPEYINCKNAAVCPNIFIEIEYNIDGDWKHEHLFSEHLIEKFIEEKEWVVVGTDKEITNETGCDWYGANHIYKVGINKEMALGFKALFVED